MSEIVCCPLDGGDERPSFCHVTTPRARKPHVCGECKESIPIGAVYERTTGKWDDNISTEITCMSCVEIRDHFACGSGWIFGYVWEQLEDNFFPEMRAGGPCMEGLSPEAKARLFERRLKWQE